MRNRTTDPMRVTALEHQLTEIFGGPERYGVPVPVPPGLMAHGGKIVLCIAAGDGRVSPRERDTFVSILRTYGAPPEEIEEVRRYEPRPQDLDALIVPQVRPILRALLFDAIRVARVDGFDARERAAAERTAEKLGLERGIVRGIEGLLTMEDALGTARMRLLSPPGQLTPGWTGETSNAGIDARAATFGPPGANALPRDFFVTMGRAILAIAAGDGDLSDAEIKWYVGQCKAMGAPVELIEENLKFDYVGTRIERIVDTRFRPYAQVAIYEGLRCARSDGVTPRERHLAERACEALGIDPMWVTALESQLDVEAALRQARVELLVPPRT